MILKEQAVKPFPVDVEAKQIVRWLIEEERRSAFGLLVTATRSYRRNALGAGEDSSLGDIEREDLSEMTEVGLLEVTPRQKPGGWTLRIRVEDDIGPGLPEDEPAPTGDEEIDLATFYEEFMTEDRGLAEVSAEVSDPNAKTSLGLLLDAILTDRHQA
jgi:hypothetical protein